MAEEDLDLEAEFIEGITPFDSDVPGYLALPEGPLRDEARIAWALCFCFSTEGIPDPKWLEIFRDIHQALKEREIPTPKTKSPSLRIASHKKEPDPC